MECRTRLPHATSARTHTDAGRRVLELLEAPLGSEELPHLTAQAAATPAVLGVGVPEQGDGVPERLRCVAHEAGVGPGEGRTRSKLLDGGSPVGNDLLQVACGLHRVRVRLALLRRHAEDSRRDAAKGDGGRDRAEQVRGRSAELPDEVRHAGGIVHRVLHCFCRCAGCACRDIINDAGRRRVENGRRLVNSIACVICNVFDVLCSVHYTFEGCRGFASSVSSRRRSLRSERERGYCIGARSSRCGRRGLACGCRPDALDGRAARAHGEKRL